jgi:hypothetical protein
MHWVNFCGRGVYGSIRQHLASRQAVGARPGSGAKRLLSWPISARPGTWLEQGRGGRHPEVLGRLPVVRLTTPEREHLFILAFGHPPETRLIVSDDIPRVYSGCWMPSPFRRSSKPSLGRDCVE